MSAGARERASARFILRSDRMLIRMYGRDPLRMIQGLATNDIAGAAENTSVYTTFLTPKGKLIGDARVVRRPGGDVWIEADRVASDNIVGALKKMVPPLFARFEVMEGYSILEVIGGPVLAADATLSNPFRPDAAGFIFTADEAANKSKALTEGGGTPIDFEELEVIRIEAGEPKWGAELTEDVIPLEAGLRDVAISQSKGCYTGQEVIIRILHRGHVNRHLRGVLLGSQDVPAVGSELTHAGKVVGRITSACVSPLMEQAIALAYIRREIEPPAVVRLGAAEVDVVALPFTRVTHGVRT